MGSDLRSVIGLARQRISSARLLRRRWRIRSVMPQNGHIAVVMHWRSAVSSWKHGRRTASAETQNSMTRKKPPKLDWDQVPPESSGEFEDFDVVIGDENEADMAAMHCAIKG